MSSGAHNKRVIRKRTRKYGIFRIACFSIAQGCKNPVAHYHCTTKNLVKKRTLSLRYKWQLVFTPSVSVFRYSSSAADANGNQTIVYH